MKKEWIAIFGGKNDENFFIKENKIFLRKNSLAVKMSYHWVDILKGDTF